MKRTKRPWLWERSGSVIKNADVERENGSEYDPFSHLSRSARKITIWLALSYLRKLDFLRIFPSTMSTLAARIFPGAIAALSSEFSPLLIMHVER